MIALQTEVPQLFGFISPIWQYQDSYLQRSSLSSGSAACMPFWQVKTLVEHSRLCPNAPTRTIYHRRNYYFVELISQQTEWWLVMVVLLVVVGVVVVMVCVFVSGGGGDVCGSGDVCGYGGVCGIY